MFKPTGLYYYYEFRLSSSTQNDEGPTRSMAAVMAATFNFFIVSPLMGLLQFL